jgi:hypothetical protein
MRALLYVGVFRERADGRIGDTDGSAYLRSDGNPSLREMSLVLLPQTVEARTDCRTDNFGSVRAERV